MVNSFSCAAAAVVAPHSPRRSSKLRSSKTAKHHDRHFVQHNYHDHAHEIMVDDASAYPNAPRQRGGVTVPFPIRLHQVLDLVQEDGYADIISWQPHGRCFVIHKPKRFVQDVMPRYFNQTKLTSFQRQLNLYGFVRLTRGPDANGYYHEYFLRGRPHLTRHLQRTRVKGTKIKAASSPEEEPDFYSMPPVGPYSDAPAAVTSDEENHNSTQQPSWSDNDSSSAASSLFTMVPRNDTREALQLQPCPSLPLLVRPKTSLSHMVPPTTSTTAALTTSNCDALYHNISDCNTNMDLQRLLCEEEPQQLVSVPNSKPPPATTSLLGALSPPPSLPKSHSDNNLALPPNSPPFDNTSIFVSLDPVDALLLELQDDYNCQLDERHDPVLSSLGILTMDSTTPLAIQEESDHALGRRLEQIMQEAAPW